MRKIYKKDIEKFKKEAKECIEIFCQEYEEEINQVAWEVNYLCTQINKLAIVLLVGKEILKEQGYDDSGRKTKTICR